LKAIVYRGPRNIRVEDVPEPRVSGRKVIVKFKAGGICGTDMHFHGGDRRWMKLGLIIGHDA
jgi:threonine dehydrogenase-like Zn-dependent dehydrogenase